MELTSEQFQKLSGCNATPATLDSEDRRKGVRVIFGKRAKIRPLFGSAPDGGKTALLRDVSVSGVGFLVADPMEVGDEFILRTPVEDGGYLYLHCIVRRCESGGTGGKQFITGASFELVLDPNTLSEEQTADHYERTEIVSASRAVDDLNDPEEEVASGSLVRGFCTRIKSVLEARQAAKLRKRLRPEGSDNASEETEDDSSRATSEEATAEQPAGAATLDSVLSSITLVASDDAAAAAANPNRRSLFASKPMAASETSEPIGATPAPTIVPEPAKELSATELAKIIASNYGTAAPAAEPATTTIEAPAVSSISAEQNVEPVVPTASSEPAEQVEQPPTNTPAVIELPAVVEPLPAPVAAPVVIPAPRVAPMSSDIFIPPAYPTRKAPTSSASAANQFIAPSAPAQPAPQPVQVTAPAVAAPVKVKEAAATGEVSPDRDQTLTKPSELSEPRVAAVAPVGAPAKPAARAVPTPEIPMTQQNNPQPAKPTAAMNSCEMVFQTPMAYSSETFEGFALPAQLEPADTEADEVQQPKSAYFPPELNGPHAAVRAASPETLLRNAAARSRHSRRSGRSTVRR